MKIKYVLLSCITFASLANALGSESIRVGIALGGSAHRMSVKNGFNNEKDKLNASSPSAGVFVGADYSISESPIFVGAEVLLTNNIAEETQNLFGNGLTATSFKIRTNNSIKPTLRFGFKGNHDENDVLLYAKAGLASTNWRMNVENPGGRYTKQFQKFGFVTGLGIESKMNQNFSVAWEHEITKHWEMKSIHPIHLLKTKPVTHTTTMRFAYSF